MSESLGAYGFWIALAAMCLATYAMRTAGFVLMRFVPLTPFVRRLLDVLPGAVVVATVLPIVAREGTIAMTAILAALAVMIWRRSDILSVAVGVAVAALIRAVAQ